jgi:putative adhesin/SHOCT-like protein
VSPTTTRSSLEHRLGAEGLFSIRVRHGEIRLRGVDGDSMTVRERHGRNLEDLFDIDLADGSASIRESLGNRRHGGSPDVEIDLPHRATVVVETSSGDLEVDDLTGDQRYRTASGDLRFRGVGGRLSIEVHSGDIDITSVGEADVNLRTLSGDVELRAGTLRSLRVNSTSGDLKAAGRLAGPGPFTIESVSGDVLLAPAGDLRIELQTVSGDLLSDIEGVTDHGRGRRSIAIGTGGPLLIVRSTSGDVRVVQAVPANGVQRGRGLRFESKDDPFDDTAEPVAGSEADPIEEPEVAHANGAIAAAYDDARMRILRSLERGEIDVAEATRRLEALDAGPDTEGTDADADTETVAFSTDEDARG